MNNKKTKVHELTDYSSEIDVLVTGSKSGEISQAPCLSATNHKTIECIRRT